MLPDFRLDWLRENLVHVMPEAACLALSARSGEGLGAWIQWLEGARAEASRPRNVVAETAGQRP